MLIRRVLTFCAVLTVLSTGSSLLLAQAPPKLSKDQEKRNKQQQQDVTTLLQLVDKVSAAEPVTAAGTTADQRQGEVTMTWDSNHFMKGQDGSTYIPLTLVIDRSTLSSPNASLYVRAVNRRPAEAPAAAPAAKDKDKDKAPARATYAWENSYFVSLKDDGKLQRALALPGGDYDIFIAIKDQGTGDKKQMPKMGLLRHSITVPDYKAAQLQTSSILVGGVETLAAPLPADQQADNPYVFGAMKIVPMKEAKLTKSGELSLLFWIYGIESDPVTKKPNVLVEYSFHTKTADGEKYFNKTAPQELNAQSLPPEFSLAAGHQLPGSLAVPLMSFPAGDYRLEIKITDKAAGKTLTQNVNFSVAS